MNNIVADEHKQAAGKLRMLLAKYQDVEMLIKLGEYKEGGDPVTDEAVRKVDAINSFLRQDVREKASFEQTIQAMIKIVA